MRFDTELSVRNAQISLYSNSLRASSKKKKKKKIRKRTLREHVVIPGRNNIGIYVYCFDYRLTRFSTENRAQKAGPLTKASRERAPETRAPRLSRVRPIEILVSVRKSVPRKEKERKGAWGWRREESDRGKVEKGNKGRSLEKWAGTALRGNDVMALVK